MTKRFALTFRESTIHGIPQMLKSKSLVLKLLWLILVVVSVSYGSLVIYQQISFFFSYFVVSLTRVNYVKSIDMPVITICNLNPFATKYSREFITQMDLQNKSQPFGNSNSSSVFEYLNTKYFVASKVWSSLDGSTRKRFGLSLNQSLISCVFNWADCALEQDFEEFYDPLYGNCFRYNFDRSKTVSFSGSMYGLQFQLLSNPMESDNSLFSMYSGFTVYFTEQTNINTLLTDGVKVGWPTLYIINIIRDL